MIILSISDVVTIHDSILETEKGAQGYHGDTKLGGALGRIQNQMLYEDLDDIFDIAAWYVEAIAMGHCFADANKRTALSAALVFLEWNDITIIEDTKLACAVEDLVKKEISRTDIADIFSSLAIS